MGAKRSATGAAGAPVDDAEPAPAWPPVRTLAVAARLLEGAFDEMTLPQYRVLSFIAASPERAGQIAAMTGVTRPSLTGILDGLVAKGWIRRVEVHGDRRGVTLEITDAGVDALHRAQASADERLDKVLGAVPAADRRRAYDGLEVLGLALKDHLVRRRSEREAQRDSERAIATAAATEIANADADADKAKR